MTTDFCREILSLQDETDHSVSSSTLMTSSAPGRRTTTAPSHGSFCAESTPSSARSSSSGLPTSCGAIRPRHYNLNPEGLANGTANVVDRCLMDSAQDEVFVPKKIKPHLSVAAYAEVKQALGNIATPSRHVGTELICVTEWIEDVQK